MQRTLVYLAVCRRMSVFTENVICPIFLVADDKTLLCLHCPTSSVMRARASMCTVSLLGYT